MPITPDTKDWTWVLERPCDECGFDPSSWPAVTIAPEVRDNAAAWARVLERDGVAERPDEGIWSPLEYACHERDVHRVFDERLRLMLTEVDPTFENWDQDATAAQSRYGEQDPAVVADELLGAADAYAARLSSVTAEEWSRPGTRSNGSQFNVETLARYELHDVVHHLWDVAEAPPSASDPT